MHEFDAETWNKARLLYRQIERGTRSAATREGLAQRRARGKPTGPAPMGWLNRNIGRRDDHREYAIVPGSATRRVSRNGVAQT